MTKPEQPNQESSLSFESLRAELGDHPFSVPSEEEHRTPAESEETPLFQEQGRAERTSPKPEIRMEALTGSSPKHRPVWAEALFCIFFSCLLLLTLIMKSGFVSYQPWISRIAILLALGGAGWASLGLRTAESKGGKRFIWGIVAGGLIIAVLAYLRMPQ